jgi:nicotinamide riboside transporter PnuC
MSSVFEALSMLFWSIPYAHHLVASLEPRLCATSFLQVLYTLIGTTTKSAQLTVSLQQFMNYFIGVIFQSSFSYMIFQVVLGSGSSWENNSVFQPESWAFRYSSL